MRPLTRLLLLGLSAAALMSCGDDAPEVRNGVWGGLGIQIAVTSASAPVTLCCKATGSIDEALTPDAAGDFLAHGSLYNTYPADYQGTVSGESMRLVIRAYTPTDPQGFTLLAPDGNRYFDLTYGTPFVEKENGVGCVCPPCVGCPP